MSGVNKAIVVGHLGGDVDLRYTPGGKAVANFSVATSESWAGDDGQRQERTEWHRIVVWGKLAELCAEHLRKGRQAYVEGRIQTREWKDKDGSKRYTTEIIANQVVFLGGGSKKEHAAHDDDVLRNAEETARKAFGMSQDDVPF